MLMLQADWLATVRAEFRTNGIKRSAVVTKDLSGVERIDLDLGTAVLTICP
jgi:hypothetical protein